MVYLTYNKKGGSAYMEQKLIKDLKLGEWFTLKPIEEPNVNQVYVRDFYCRSEKKYVCFKFSDGGSSRLFRGDKVVYVGFTF